MICTSGRSPFRGPPFFIGALLACAIAQAAPERLPADTSPLEPEPGFAVPTTLDRIGRIVVPVKVNGRGPFKFVFDTGANTTVISPHLATTLGLQVENDSMVNLQAITGSAFVPTAIVERVESGAVVLENRRLAVADATTIGTDGILGVEGLARKLVLVDFIRDNVRVLDATRVRPADNLTRIPARLRFKRLLMVEAKVGEQKVAAVIDTGGHRTLGNPALYRLLRLKPPASELDRAAEVIGATDVRQSGERHLMRQVTLGEMRVNRLVVTFGDFYIFKVWDLENRPALIIGMDLIGILDTFGVDYYRREVQIRARR